MIEPSSTTPQRQLLTCLEDFQRYHLVLLQQSRRHLTILTHDLDAQIYGTPDYLQALSDFVRSSRHCQVQILLKDTRTAIAIGHPVVRLAQRLSSKIHLRKITQEPQNKDMGFVLGDTDKLLYQNAPDNYRGFFKDAAAPDVKRLEDEFQYLWQYAEPEPEFQQLYL